MRTKTNKLWRLGILYLVALYLMLGVSSVSSADGFSFISFDFPGAVSTQANGINPAGNIVGYYADAEGTNHGFLLSKGAFTRIDVPGSIFTNPGGINPAGEIVGGYVDSNGTGRGFLLSK